MEEYSKEISVKEFYELLMFRIRTNDYETKLNKEERYILNKIMSDRIQNMNK